MTTPNQPAPNSLETLLGVGHFEIGGGDTNYGQGIDENFVNNLVTIPFATLGNMLEVLAEVLLKLPLEALQAFSSLVPDWIPGGETQGSAVGKILGILDPRQALQTVEDFLTWVGEVFTPLQGLVGGINSSLDRVIAFLQRFVDALISGIRGIPLFGPSIADALSGIGFSGAGEEDPDILEFAISGITDTFTTLGNNVDSTQQSTETLSGYFNTPRAVPSWMGTQADDVAFDIDKIDGTTAPTLGQVVLIPVKVLQDRVYDAVKFGVTDTTMTNCYVGLYATDLTTGDLTKVLDLGDRKSDLDTAFSQQTIPLDDIISVQKGELYYIGVLQVGGTAVTMHRSSSTTPFTTGLYPRYRGNVYTAGSQASLPSSIAVSDVVTGTRFWGALGTATEPVTAGSVFLSDSFNRADSSSLGPSWTHRWGMSGGTIGISGNRPRVNSTTGAAVSTHNTRLTTTSQRAGFTHYGDAAVEHMVSVRGNGLGPCVQLALLASNSGSGTYVARITTRTSYDHTVAATLRDSYDAGFSGGLVGNWAIEATSSTYTAYQDGVQRLQWVDSGGAFTVNANNTEVSFTINDGPLGGTPTFDDWFAQDL